MQGRSRQWAVGCRPGSPPGPTIRAGCWQEELQQVVQVAIFHAAAHAAALLEWGCGTQEAPASCCSCRLACNRTQGPCHRGGCLGTATPQATAAAAVDGASSCAAPAWRSLLGPAVAGCQWREPCRARQQCGAHGLLIQRFPAVRCGGRPCRTSLAPQLLLLVLLMNTDEGTARHPAVRSRCCCCRGGGGVGSTCFWQAALPSSVRQHGWERALREQRRCSGDSCCWPPGVLRLLRLLLTRHLLLPACSSSQRSPAGGRCLLALLLVAPGRGWQTGQQPQLHPPLPRRLATGAACWCWGRRCW